MTPPNQPWPGYTGLPYPPYQPPAPAPARRRWVWPVVSGAAFFLGASIGTVSTPAEPAVQAAETVVQVETTTVTAAPPAAPARPATPKPPAPKPAAATTIPGDGTFAVGAEVQPGMYRTAGPASYGCYWERLSGLSGGFDQVLANEYASGPMTVTIRPSDKGFKTSGCQEWRKVG